LAHLHFSTGRLFTLMDTNRSNTISFGEFKNGLALSGLRPFPTDKVLHQVFKSFDLDGNNSLTYRELEKALEADHDPSDLIHGDGHESTYEQSEGKQCGHNDEPGDQSQGCPPIVGGRTGTVGEWTIASLRQALYKYHISTGLLFSFMDADRSDTISFSEFCYGVQLAEIRPVPSSDQLRDLFDMFDHDEDGYISYREMLRTLGGGKVNHQSVTQSSSPLRHVPLRRDNALYNLSSADIVDGSGDLPLDQYRKERYVRRAGTPPPQGSRLPSGLSKAVRAGHGGRASMGSNTTGGYPRRSNSPSSPRQHILGSTTVRPRWQ